jgi:hypothetical protein
MCCDTCHCDCREVQLICTSTVRAATHHDQQRSGRGSNLNVARPIYDVDMGSAADIPHDLVVDGPLADELECRGVHVHAGDRLRLQLVPNQRRTDERTAA